MIEGAILADDDDHVLDWSCGTGSRSLRSLSTQLKWSAQIGDETEKAQANREVLPDNSQESLCGHTDFLLRVKLVEKLAGKMSGTDELQIKINPQHWFADPGGRDL